MRSIVITGSECTGKTSLARNLAARLGALWLPEQARVYAESVGRPLTADDVEPIARAHLVARNATMSEAMRRRDTNFLLDTDLVSTIVYARHYYGECPRWIVDAARTGLGDLYLLCDIDVPWTGDAIRDRPLARQELHDSFRHTLADLGVPVVLIRGLGDTRMQSALDALGAGEATDLRG